METIRSRALKGLATTMPIANQQVAQGLQAARMMGVQRAVAQAPAPASTREVQAAGAQQTQQAGQIQNQAAQQTQQALTQVGQLGLAEQARGAQEDLGQKKLAVASKARANEAALASLGQDVKQQLFDSKMQFARDENGRAALNEQQLADWAVLKAKSAEGFKATIQKVEQLHRRKMEMLRVAEQKIRDAMAFEAQKKIQDRDQGTMETLKRAEIEMKEKIQREAARQANRLATWQAGGAILGGVGAGIISGGNPTAIGAGVAGGGAAGTAAGSANA